MSIHVAQAPAGSATPAAKSVKPPSLETESFRGLSQGIFPQLQDGISLRKDVLQGDLHVAARVEEEERQRICSHAENSTSNHTGKQTKTLYGGVGVSKVMSTHSER